MVACTRCGRKHTDAEDTLGKRLSCTEVQRYWIEIRKQHQAIYGHYAQVSTDDDGNWICYICKRKL